MNGWPNAEQTLLLKAALSSGASAQEAWQGWRQQVEFDEVEPASFKLLPLVSRNLALGALHDPIFEKCKGVYRQTWVANQLHWQRMQPVLIQLLNSGVEKIVLLKGMAMTLHFYRDFGVRVMGDIDILIAKEQLPIAVTFLLNAGWQQFGTRFDLANPDHLRRWHALSFIHPMGMNLDLHWSFIQENSSGLDQAVLQGAQQLPTGFYVPNPTDLFLQTCVHGVKYSPVPLIRWIADAMTILRQSEIDWKRLIDLARTAHICMPLRFALEYLVEQFAAPIPKAVVQELQAHPSTRLEQLEYRHHAQGNLNVANWYRYCLTRGYLTRRSQMLHVHQFLQFTARLKSPWYIPFYGVYWIFKRVRRAVI